MTEVCLAVGCTSLGSFSARFTELVGESPSAYRARDHAPLAQVPACWAKVVTRPSEVRVKLTVQTLFLEVDDHDAALTFYHDVLGLEVRNDVKLEFGRWVTVGPGDQPDLGIVLQSVGVGRPPADAQALQSLLAKGSLGGLVFTTDDVDGVYAKVRASGAEVLQEPMDMPYGVRDCAFRDPAGNMVRFNQSKVLSARLGRLCALVLCGGLAVRFVARAGDMRTLTQPVGRRAVG